MTNILFIGLGGFFGAISRFLMSRFIGRLFPHFPYGTLAVNVLGSFLLGFIGYSIIYGKNVSPEMRSLINIGFIGAFTTMSTFAFETHRIFDVGQTTAAIANIVANVAVCLAAVMCGRFLAVVLLK